MQETVHQWYDLFGCCKYQSFHSSSSSNSMRCHPPFALSPQNSSTHPPTLHWPDPFERIASLCERLGTLLEAACAAASPIPLACWGKERSQLSSLGGGQKQPKWLMEFIQMWDWSLVFSSMANILMEHSWNIEKNDGHRIEFVVTHLCKCMKLRSLGWNLIPGWNPKEWESEKKKCLSLVIRSLHFRGTHPNMVKCTLKGHPKNHLHKNLLEVIRTSYSKQQSHPLKFQLPRRFAKPFPACGRAKPLIAAVPAAAT